MTLEIEKKSTTGVSLADLPLALWLGSLAWLGFVLAPFGLWLWLPALGLAWLDSDQPIDIG